MFEAEELLRQNVKALKGKRTQRQLAKAIGVSDTNMSDFLAGKQGLGLDKLAPLAKELGAPIADLFVVRKTTSVTASVTPGTGKSPSQHDTGDGTDGPSTADLRQQLKERDERIHDLQVAVRAHVKQIREATDLIGALIGAPRHDVRKVARGKSKTS